MFAFFGGLFALALLTYAVVTQVSLGIEEAKSDIEERLSALAGQPVVVDGSASFSLLPTPQATLTDVRVVAVGASEPYQFEIDVVLAELDAMDALFGRTVIDRLTFIRPEGSPGGALVAMPGVTPTGPTPVETSDGSESERLRAFTRAFLGRFEGVRTLIVRDGALRSADGGDGLSSINIDFSWPSPSAAATLTGNVVWNGEPADVDLVVDDPLAFGEGAPSPIELSVAAPSVSGTFTGVGSLGATADLSGRLSVETPSLARAARWLGRAPPDLPDFGAFALETDIRLGTDRLDLEAVDLEIGGFEGRGALEATQTSDGRVAVGGTLAFDTLAIDEFARAIAPMPRNALELQRPIAVAFVRSFDLDLRLSAIEATIAAQPVRDLAATIKLVGGVATLDIGDAQFLGGRAAAHLSLDATTARPYAVARVILDGVEAGQMMPVLGVQAIAITGRSDVNATFEGPVSSWADMLRANLVEATIETRDGTFSGLDPAAMLAVGERTLDAGPGNGSFPFERFTTTIDTRGSAARLRVIRIEGPAGIVEADGSLSLLTERIDVEGVFRPSAEADAQMFTPSQPLRFTIDGEWPDPVVTVAAQSAPI